MGESYREKGESEIGRVEEGLCTERGTTMSEIKSQQTCYQQGGIEIPDKICQCERVQWFGGKASDLVIVDIG